MEGKEKEFFMGIDIEKGSPISNEEPKFAAIIIKESGKVIDKFNEISLSSLIRIAWDWKPKYIATDNVFELAPDERSISKIISLLPPRTKLVQVTIENGKFVSIKEMARKLGIETDQSKLTASKTAYLAALIASKGRGSRISFSNEKTQIIVSKARWTKKGGMSQARYQRRIRASIYIAVKKVKESLQKAGVDYDIFVKKSEGGLDSAVFVAYQPREKLYGIVRPHRGIDYVIKIKPIFEGKLLFDGLLRNNKRDKPIIVGIDPGMTIGIAIIDLEGNVLYLDSKKEMDRGNIISLIYSYGKPILIATDVKEIPDMVKKLAAQIKAEIYVPNEDIPVIEKLELALRALRNNYPGSTHERDALAAAYKAYLFFKSKLSQVESYVSKMDIDLDVEKIKADVIKGVSIANAVEKQINEMIKTEFDENNKKIIHNDIKERNCKNGKATIEELIHKIEKLRTQKAILENKINELNKYIANLQNEIRISKSKLKEEVLKDEAIEKLNDEINRLKGTINEVSTNLSIEEKKNEMLRSVLFNIMNKKLLLIRRVESLTMKSIKKHESIYGKLNNGDLVLVEDTKNFENKALEYISAINIPAVILSRENDVLSNILRKHGIIPLSKGKYKIIDLDYFTLVEFSIIKDISMEKKASEVSKGETDLSSIIEEYRKNRMSLFESNT